MSENLDEIEVLFKKYIDNTITKEEYTILMCFIEDPKHKAVVSHLIKTHSEAKVTFKNSIGQPTEDSANILFDKISNEIEELNSSRKGFGVLSKRHSNIIYKVAASVAILFGVFYFFQNDLLKNWKSNNQNATVENNQIILKLNNGNIEVISESGKRKIVDVNGNVVGEQVGNQLDYTNKATVSKLVYNELSVPYGKQFDLVLSDGTKIKLNAGTSIKYPVQFLVGKSRKVFLKGEAYFDVAKDKEHPFIINANDINVRVLGTSFNMSYYEEDDEISTVLIEGAVALYEEGKENDKTTETILTPGHKASWNKASKKMMVSKVDIGIYTAWKDGILLFKNTPFHLIKKKLERHFDVVIDNQFIHLDKQVYTASFKEETIEDILESFKEDTPFGYTKENNTITINKLINKR